MRFSWIIMIRLKDIMVCKNSNKYSTVIHDHNIRTSRKLARHVNKPLTLIWKVLIHWSYEIWMEKRLSLLSGKKSKSVFDFLTYSRDQWTGPVAHFRNDHKTDQPTDGRMLLLNLFYTDFSALEKGSSLWYDPRVYPKMLQFHNSYVRWVLNF